MAKSIPAGWHTVTPHLIVDPAAAALGFYRRAFGAVEVLRMPGPDGKIAHAEMAIGDSRIMLSDEPAPMEGQPGVYKSPKAAGCATAALFLYVEAVDAVFAQAVREGCRIRRPLQDMFWGDRYAQVIDPFGHTWGLATHVEDVTPEEIARRQKDLAARMTQPQARK